MSVLQASNNTSFYAQVNLDIIRENQKNDPHYQLKTLGFSAMESFILELSPIWKEVKNLVRNNTTKNEVLTLVKEHGIKF